MSAPEAVRSAHRLSYLMGLGMCLGTPSVVGALILLRVIPPGTAPVEGLILQVGYLLTGLVFLAAAWVWWRSGRMVAGFQQLPAAQQPPLLLREGLAYAAACEVSCLCGLVYWALVGTQATRHVWGFIALTPVLFLTLVPRLSRWVGPSAREPLS